MKKRGISLLVLIITIIVIIILAGAVILTLINSNTFDQSKKAKFMSDYRTVQEGVNLFSLSKYNASTNEFELPLKGYLTEEDKTYITDNVPTLKTKIEELSGTIDTVNLAWISSEDIGVKLAANKAEKGYILDVANGLIYDYNGDYFEGQMWHTLDGGVLSNGSGAPTVPKVDEELWNGWIKLNLYYPSNSTEKQWRLGSEGELRVDPMLMWQNYTGPITVPIDRVKDVWIKYKIDNKEIIIPPAGKLLVDIVPDKTGYAKVPGVKVHINFDETATVKEYKVGESEWMPYVGEFNITENCIIEARAKKTETIYNTDGTVLTTRNITGSDMVYIGNIAIEEITLAAPTITRLPAVDPDEKARVQITYPANASKKVYTVNYGVKEDYVGEISVKEYGTYIIAYYYDASGKKSASTSIYINDTTTGNPPVEPKPHEPLPPYDPKNPPIFDPKNPPVSDPKQTVSLPAPTITRLAGQNSSEKARVQITYPIEAAKKVYTQNYGTEQNYSQDIVVNNWSTFIMAYYYDADGNRSNTSYIRINEVVTPPDTYPEPPKIDTILTAPTINLDPISGYVPSVTVSVSSPAVANKTYIKIGRYGDYQEYTSSIVARDNLEIYAYYKTTDGKQSQEARARIQNIKIPGDTGNTSASKPYVYIDAVVYPWISTYGQSSVKVTVKYNDADKIEYSEDGVIYLPYTGSFDVTENKRIYARGTNINGVTETYLDITNIGKLTPPKTLQKLAININVNPEPKVSTTKVAKATVSIEYDEKAVEKYYKIGYSGDLKEYTGSFEVDKSCTIYAMAKAPNSLGQASKTIDNIVDGISEPEIIATPSNKIQASKVTIKINYDKYATIKRYSINGGSLRDYTGDIEVTKNGTKILAYSENIKGQSSSATYIVENIIPPPPVLLLDKGSYYILKLNYPDGSNGREYKWTSTGDWKSYKEAGILLIKPQFKDTIIQNGTLVKIQDESGNLVTFTGDYYLINVPISEMFENVFMRWDRVAAGGPQIVLDTTEPAKEVTATIIYDKSLKTKQYRVLNPGGTLGNWQNYTGPITVDINNSIIYARGMDDSEVWSNEGMLKVTNIDETPPVINLTADLTTAMQKVAIKVNVTDDVEVGKVKWAPGIQGESYFASLGTAITNNSIVNITSNGYYTFYAEDRVGNMQVYTLNVTNVDLTAPVIDIQVTPETTVGISANVTINYGDSVTKQYKVGTANTTWTNYTTSFAISSYTILANNWQNADGTVTIYAKGKDAANNEIIVQKKVVSLDLDKPKSPVINSRASYPTLTAYGIKFDDTTTIVYDTRTDIDNYYSINNGTTWTLYTNSINVTTGTIIAKSVKKGSGLEVSVSQTVAIPTDAMKVQVYDGNNTTYTSNSTNQYMAVDNSMQGKNVRIKWNVAANNQSTQSIIFLDESKQVISQINKTVYNQNIMYDEVYTIPLNTKWIKSFNIYGLYEIQSSNEPTFAAGNNQYMLLTLDPRKIVRDPYQMVNINYFPTSVQRLYRIGTSGEWLNYNDQPVKVLQNQTIYAKGIDQSGIETRVVSSYTVNITDSLSKEAFDGNLATYAVGGARKYMQVDTSMQGKPINLKWILASGISASASIVFLDVNKQQISSITKSVYNSTGNYNEVVTIPINTNWIAYDGQVNGYTYLYEIQTSDEPTFSPTSQYMLLSVDPTKSIREPHQMVVIDYFPTSAQRLYRIGTTGEWLEYNDQPAKVLQGQTIYAKGIDQSGLETRVVASYTATMTDAMGAAAYDGNNSTYIMNNNVYMQVDSTMYGKSIGVLWNRGAIGNAGSIYLKFLDANKNTLNTVSRATIGTYNDVYVVPVNTKWIMYTYDGVLGNYNAFYEIGVSNEPTFSSTNGYMLLTADPANAIRTAHQMVTISYFESSIQKLYRIGTTGEWLNYANNPIKLNQGQTIYAKGIDQYGNETRIIPSYTANVPDALKAEAFDNNLNTATYDKTDQYIEVDPSMIGKTVKAKWDKGEGIACLSFLDSNRTVISTVKRNSSINGITLYTDTYTVPANTKYIKYHTEVAYASIRLYELYP